jgi:hypothetical protein
MSRALALVVALTALHASSSFADEAEQALRPEQTIALFNGRDLSGWTTWLKDTKREDPRKVFGVDDGLIHLSGDGDGYIATEKAYRDYQLHVEYRWGKFHKGKFVRNSGVLLNAVGPDGGAGGAWPSCLECQLAQGCVGDLILIRGKDEQGKEIPVSVTAETALAPDGRRRRWHAGGEKVIFPPARGQLWWRDHDWDFAEALDTRGRNDIESPVGDWTSIDVECHGSTISIQVNNKLVNQVTDVFPSTGRILLQTEGSEIYFRNVELRPLAK